MRVQRSSLFKSKLPAQPRMELCLYVMFRKRKTINSSW